MQRLPKWMICDKFPAMYDLESATAIEQTAKVYGAMQTLIDEYNSFAERVNKIIDDFETYATKENEEFRVALRQVFQDFIDIINLKVKAQDKEIADRFNAIVEDIEQRFTAQDETISKAVSDMLEEMRENFEAQNDSINKAIEYMRENVETTVTQIIENMIETGDIDETIANAFDSMSTRVNEIVETITTIQNDIINVNERINALIEKDAEHDAEIEGLKAVDEELREAVTIFTNAEGNAPLTIEGTKTGTIFDIEIIGRSDKDEYMVVDKILSFKKGNLINRFLLKESVTTNTGVNFTKNEDGTFNRQGTATTSYTWSGPILGGKNGTSVTSLDDVLFELEVGKYYVMVDCTMFVVEYNPTTKEFSYSNNLATTWDSDATLLYVGYYSDTEHSDYCLAYSPNTGNKLYCVGIAPQPMRKNTYDDVITPMIIEVKESEIYKNIEDEFQFTPYGDGAKVIDFNILQNKPTLTEGVKICKRAGVWGIETDGNFEMFSDNRFVPATPLLQEEFNSLMMFDGETVIDVLGTISGTDKVTNTLAIVKLSYMGNNQIALVLSDLLARVTALENK